MVVVGFMASGKSTVGARIAASLGWDAVDVDAEIVRQRGRSIAAIFADEGEAAFRRLEAEAVREALRRKRVVVIPGGGWAAAGPDRLTDLPPGTLAVWLRIGAEAAVRRARASPGERPLLAGPDPLATAFALLAERERFYAPAHLHLDVEGSPPDALVEKIRAHLQLEPPTL